MNKWSGVASVAYKRWRNPELRSDANFVGQFDEVQGTDNEICTVTAGVVSGDRASASGSDQPEEILTVDDALEAIGFGKFQWKMSALTGLSWVGDAMEMMILSILGPQLHCEWRLPGYQVALITSVVFIGMVFGSPSWGNVCDTYGRKVGLTMCMCWSLFYGLLSAFAPVYGWLLFLRSLVGFGVAGAPQSVTLYSEFLPVKARGMCIMMIATFWALGSVFEVLLALFVMPTLGWRWLLGLSTIPMAIFVCFCFWLPESARFHVLTGKAEKAMATLTRIANDNGKAMPRGKIVACQQNNRRRIKDLFTPQFRRTTLLLWFSWFANSFSYYGIVLLTTELFQAGHTCAAAHGAKIEPNCSLECKYLTSADYKDLLWTTLAEFPGLLVILLLIDRIGRKKSMALCFFMYSVFILPLFACLDRLSVTICIFIARAFISGGFQVAFVYTPEVFPTEIRAFAMGTCSAISRLGGLITPFVAQVLLRASLPVTLSLYCGLSLLGGIAALILPIETLGRSLRETISDQEA
ncbi:synaptic vesicle 2-related protein-like [Plectropomus leopardus]|uniref:synaptic vesicle 2-related protein-like n=1 Tax=Plectropomus leopardus TaxID=160734 RepID=UPI001C4C1738|nr:synaptic vesicle 2-related protein-like [Plectropomus leopardus]